MVEHTEAEGSDEDADAPTPKRSLMERLMDAAPTAPAKPSLDRNGNPTKWAIDRLDGHERVYSYLSGFLAIFFAVLLYVSETSNHHFHLKKDQFTPDTTLVVGIVCAAALVLTTYLGRRALVGFVALFTFLGFQSSAIVVGLPFLLLAVWLLYRSYKVQKEVTARIRADKADKAGGTTEPAAPRPSRAEAAAARRAGGRTSGRSKAPKGPEGNKRYTPKKPAPPPIPVAKPSWRERRATKASD